MTAVKPEWAAGQGSLSVEYIPEVRNFNNEHCNPEKNGDTCSRCRYVLNYFYFLVFMCFDKITQRLYGAVEHFSDDNEAGGRHNEEQVDPLSEKKADQEHE